MKIIEDYIALKRYHIKFFRMSVKQRIDKKEEIIVKKAGIDRKEITIINSIINYSIDFDDCYAKLKKVNFEGFLDENSQVNKFLKEKELYELSNYNELEELDLLIEYETLCKKVWKDFIITNDERKSLDQFCLDNNIDEVQQRDIETDIIGKINTQIDVEKTVRYYHLNEQKSLNEILIILKEEYLIKVQKDKLESLINTISEESKKDESAIYNGGKLVKKIKVNSDTIHLLRVSKDTKYEFDISYFEIGVLNNDHYKILICENLLNAYSEDTLIDVITDAHLYKSFNTHQNNAISKFLYHKRIVKNQIRTAFYS